MPSSKILIPVDGSSASLHAINFGIEMATQNSKISLVLLNVQNIPAIALADASAMPIDWPDAAVSQASDQALKGAIERCEGASVDFKTLVKTGKTAETIAQVADEEGVKHIVMGTRGLGGVQGLLLGSVTTKVIHLAQVPITLIK
jgi:nucleotide-binding universal stress UspA family protein